MVIRYGSICSGIEAVTCAWHTLGFAPQWFSEIAPFPSAVLAARWPGVPNLGDMTTIGDDVAPIDLLVGGTPCQSFSVAGLRGGLADPRGNLALVFLRLAQRTRSKWVVWENVPGVLSSDGGRDFGSILGALVELGYGFAYRVLDAQFFGVPQRRRRVFVVGYLGDWRRAAAVLFERHGLSWDPPPSREAGQDIAGALGGVSPGGDWRVGADEAAAGQVVAFAENSRAELRLEGGDGSRTGALSGGGGKPGQGMPVVAHTLRGNGFDAGEDGTGRGTPLVAFGSKGHGQDAGDVSPTLRGRAQTDGHANDGAPVAITAFPSNLSAQGIRSDRPTLTANSPTAAALPSGVRRLTPRECERLQGFPDDWTLIDYNGKPAKDGPRYEAIGNSMAVPVLAWIGRRIAAVEEIAT